MPLHVIALICIFSWFTAKISRPKTRFHHPKRNSRHNLGAESPVLSQGAQLASLLHTDIGQDRVRVVRRRPTNDDVLPLEWEVLYNLNLMMLEHQDIIVFQVKV